MTSMPKASDPQHAKIHEGEGAFDAEVYEQSNVHSIYESIASHFSNTRYKPWPLIPKFVNSLPSGSVGADLGCGNGKYLSLRSVVTGKVEQQGIVAGNDIITLGLDRSFNLIDLAQNTVVVGERASLSIQNEVCVGDALQSFYRSKCFDFALSIATIHHFSTALRRVQAVKEIIRIVRPISSLQFSHGEEQKRQRQTVDTHDDNDAYQQLAKQATGRFLIYVWALEQRGESRRKFEQISPNNDEQGRDLLVPWILKSSDPGNTAEKQTGDDKDKVFQRYYHVFEKGELESLVEDAAREMPEVIVHLEISGWERGNWYGIWQCVDNTDEGI
ncbi:hypothetical protein CBS101457_001506 [Exobasidium rhododendri]|nr:hypothetical protein CBS101457_001506 [Exobasidium rhododendri]